MGESRAKSVTMRRRIGGILAFAVISGVCNLHQAYSTPFNEDAYRGSDEVRSVDDFGRERSHHHSHSRGHHHHFHNHDGRREHQNHHLRYHQQQHEDNERHEDHQETQYEPSHYIRSHPAVTKDSNNGEEREAVEKPMESFISSSSNSNGEDSSTPESHNNEHSPLQHQQQAHQDQDDGPYFEGYRSSRSRYNHNHGNCQLPDSWKGKWFQSGIPNPILIDSKSIEGKGTCYESSGDKFLFVEKGNCHRCVVINKRHLNVLEYKESPDCDHKKNLNELCELIPGDANLYSLFRVEAEPVICPFKGPYTFTYNRANRGQCKNPVSHVDTCTEPSRLLLRYQACPDVEKSESYEEELQCLAEWREGTNNYLVGKLNYRLAVSNEERYRCFIYEFVKSHTVVKIAVSGDATCNGLASPTEGEKTMTFTKVNEGAGSKCKFPNWVSSHHWHSLDGKLSVKTNHKNSTMHIVDNGGVGVGGAGSSVGGREPTSSFSSSGGHHHHHHTNPGGGGIYNSGNFQNSLDSFGNPRSAYSLFSGGSRITCQATKELSEDHVTLMATHTEGCTSTTVCMHFYKRDSHVIELQMRKKGYDDYDCGKATQGPRLPYVTLIKAEGNSQRCPYLGKYMATGVLGTPDGRLLGSSSPDLCAGVGGGSNLPPSSSPPGGSSNLQSQHGAFHSVVVGCGQRATMDFHSKCVSQEPITSYECHGHWDEDGTGFLIASPLSRSSTSASRFCFTYLETAEGFQFFSSSQSCRRDVRPNVEGIWAFNLTVDGQCAEPMTGGAARSTHCDLYSSYFFAILVLVTFYTCSVSSIQEAPTSSSSSSSTECEARGAPTLVSDLFYSLFAKIFESRRRISSRLLTSSHPVQVGISLEESQHQQQNDHHLSRRMTTKIR